MVDRRVGRDGEFKGFVVERLMRRVGQNNRHLVLTGGQPHQDHRLSAGVSPVPRRAVHHHVNVPDARGDLERVGAEYRLDAQVFGLVLDKHRAFA